MPGRISVGGDHSKKVILRGFFGNLKFKPSKGSSPTQMVIIN
jgi:hypothetical protein